MDKIYGEFKGPYNYKSVKKRIEMTVRFERGHEMPYQDHWTSVLPSIGNAIALSIEEHGVAILPPLDVEQTLELVRRMGLRPKCTILDPWYNKGVGGTRDDYVPYILNLLQASARVSDHVFLWGFPEIVAVFVDKLPPPLTLVAWLTWYYKNSPSVIRGWRSSQMACLHLSVPGAKLYPEHFMNEAQLTLREKGKLRYIPGPTSVIEAPLLVGFVGKSEQTGHPAQKPISVFQRIIEMTTVEGDLVLDPMSGSGTTGEAARSTGRVAILGDESSEYTSMMEKRLGVKRIAADNLLMHAAQGATDEILSPD